MKHVVIGAHLEADDIGPLAEAIPVGELWLSGMPIDDAQPLGDRALLLRVAETRAALLDRATFIAIRYGFTAYGESDATGKCAGHLARWQRVLRECRGMVEMTIKVAAEAPHARPDRHDFASGAAYIRALHDATRAAAVAPEFRRAVDERLAPLAVQHRWSVRDNASLEIALLVRKESVETVNGIGETLKRELNEVPFLLSGPWPLEVFADDHE
jgi:Gas vesicle synthesis protein GvpL/GvpF